MGFRTRGCRNSKLRCGVLGLGGFGGVDVGFRIFGV